MAFSLLNADKDHSWQPIIGFLGIEPLLPAYAEYCAASSVPYEYFAATAGKPWKTWQSIARWLEGCSPDAIILHIPTALLPCLFHVYRRGAMLVVVEHTPNALKTRSEWLFSLLAMRLVKRVVLLTPDYQQEIKRQLGFFYCSRKVQVIPNGIDTMRFVPQRCSQGDRRSVQLGMAARFTSTKRQEILVLMMSELYKLDPGINWQLSLAGGGENLELVRDIVLGQGLEHCVRLSGQLDETELINWYRSLDVYLHASDGETLSTSLLQAMSMALPIVASGVPGIQNLLLGESICGVLVEDQSPGGFAKAVYEIFKNPTNASALGLSARRLAVSSYSQSEMFRDYAEIIINRSGT